MKGIDLYSRKTLFNPIRLQKCSTVIATAVLVAWSSLCFGQQQKKLLPEDYGLWGSLVMGQTSTDGKWASFSMVYDSGGDTLFLKQVVGNKAASFAGGQRGLFTDNNHFVCNTPQGLELVSLRTLKGRNLGLADNFEASKNNIVIHSRLVRTTQRLALDDLKNGKSLVLEGVTGYHYNANANQVAAIVQSEKKFSVTLIDLDAFTAKQIYQSESSISSLHWHHWGKHLAFVQAEKDRLSAIIVYDIKEKKIHTLNISDSRHGLIDGQITNIPFSLQFSDSGEKIAFYIKPNSVAKEKGKGEPQVWNTFDKKIYPAKNAIRDWHDLPKMAIWAVKQERCSMVTSIADPQITLSGQMDFAIVWNTLDKEPDHNGNLEPDYSVVNLSTAQRVPLCAFEGQQVADLSISPDGKLALYFDNQNWWAYEFLTSNYCNLTANLPHSFARNDFNWPATAPAYGSAGWDATGKYVLLYDHYDIWKIVPGGRNQRLTKGREKLQRFRIANSSVYTDKVTNFNGRYAPIIDLKKKVLLQTVKDDIYGYSLLEPTGKITSLINGPEFSSDGVLSQSGEFVCSRQNFDHPPHLIHVPAKGLPARTFYESNKHYFTFGKPEAEKITYSNSKGQVLEGVLFYPLSYDKSRKYPVIVRIYEKQTWEMNKYINPSLYNLSGSNVSNFTGDGYFVFLPDIVYGFGTPGNDALDCVTAAVTKLKKRKDIDMARIGLIGHSFGGYETNYIIGHSNLFAVAVSGAAINDLTSFYHYVIPRLEKPNFFHMETGQFRIGKPFFADPKAYVNASPLFSAGDIKTPLLSWCGINDIQIDKSQTIGFYLAMRRQGKEHIALLYPEEGHILTGAESQRDLTLKIMQWFGHYLKEEALPQWAHPDYR